MDPDGNGTFLYLRRNFDERQTYLSGHLSGRHLRFVLWVDLPLSENLLGLFLYNLNRRDMFLNERRVEGEKEGTEEEERGEGARRRKGEREGGWRGKEGGRGGRRGKERRKR